MQQIASCKYAKEKMLMKKMLSLVLALMFLMALSTTALADGLLPLAEPMEFTVVVKQGAQDLSTDYGEKLCYIQLADKTNVKINWMPFKSTAYGEKVTQMIAANDLPDAFAGGSFDVTNNYEVLLDISPYLEEYMPNWNRHLNENPLLRDTLTMTDGGIYCLPVGAGPNDSSLGLSIINSGMLYVNDEFLNNYLDGKVPTSLDELYAALVIAKNNDINGNGVADEIPLLACNNYRGGLDDMFRFFGLPLYYMNYVAYTDDTQKEITFLANTDAYKDALTTLSQWYAEGLINSDVYSMTYDDYSTRFYEDSSMVAFCINYTPDMCFSNGLSNWTPIVYLDNGDYDKVVVSHADYEQLEGMALTTKCENPEVLLSFIDAINDDFETWAQWRYGNKDEIWCYAEDGEHYYTYVMGKGLETGLAYGKFRQTYSAHLYGLSYGGIYETLKLEDPATEVKGNGRSFFYKAVAEQLDESTIHSSVIRHGYWDADLTEELSDKETEINTYCDRFKAEAVAHGITDESWDAYIKQLQRMDLDGYIDLFNQYLTRND